MCGTIVAHLARLAVGVLLNDVIELLASRHLEDAVYLGHRLLVHLTQSTSALGAITIREPAIYILMVFIYPLPHGTLLGVHLGEYVTRCETIARSEDIVAYETLQGELLATLLTLNKET
jgi:hypothetical protein